MLTDPSMSLQPEWHAIYTRDKYSSAAQYRQAMKRLTELNRQLLVAAFPSMIQPPQPIIGPRLLIAFCLLGLFPVTVKHLMPWIKRRMGRL
jgi:hypothetical protein